MTDEGAIVDAFAQAVKTLGGLDALVTSAGVAEMTPFMELDAATFRRVYNDNVVGTFLCIREAAKHMEPRRAHLHRRQRRRVCAVAACPGRPPTRRARARCLR